MIASLAAATRGTSTPIHDVDAEFAALVDQLTRRGLLVGTAAAGLATFAGRGQSTSPPSAAPTGNNVVSTIHGSIDVPAEPRRIVPTDFPEACALLDLGITPVGRPSYMPSFPAYTRSLKGVPTIDEASSGNLEIEKIASLHPDLIVGDDWATPGKQRVPYQDLRQIAPTALFAWQQAAGNWPQLAAQTAAAVGKTDQLTALSRRYKNHARAINKANSDLFARIGWDIIDCGQDFWDLYSKNSSHGQVLNAAGVRLQAASNQTAGYVQYSLEALTRLRHTDVILTTPASLPYLRKQALFRQLPAAKAGRVYTTDLFFPASYGIAEALLDVVTRICAKLDQPGE